MNEAIELLKQLIATPSFSKEEDATADIIFDFLQKKSLAPQRLKNNVWVSSPDFNPLKPVLLLNSHHDTVRPAASYTCDPFEPTIKDGKLFGLGSNDAGASVVSLIQTFCQIYNKPSTYNLILAISAEEEISGENGLALLLPRLPLIDCAIVGEPTQMKAAIAERGLMVLDCTARGVSGHAARNEGDNALYRAADDLAWFRSFSFPKKSPLMGEVKMTVTQIAAGTQHNVIPDECRFVVDVRPTDVYSNEEILTIIRSGVQSEVRPRSTRHKASAISEDHYLVQTAVAMDIPLFISPTTSDIVRMNFPAIKMGVGDSARSHQADEFVYISEIEEGIKKYIEFVQQFCNQ
ncbi:MAG: M20 family metallo-hydrolase [Prevotellaceae bacterium]|jgi:acetylornithine deacetylase|nr:M20 family metallo-hydrolase [Prevotellaceae bacterium]